LSCFRRSGGSAKPGSQPEEEAEHDAAKEDVELEEENDYADLEEEDNDAGEAEPGEEDNDAGGAKPAGFAIAELAQAEGAAEQHYSRPSLAYPELGMEIFDISDDEYCGLA
jgi:hypothetical protein